MGILETMVSGYGNSLYRDAVAFGVLILILLIKPSGIFGENTGEKVGEKCDGKEQMAKNWFKY